MARKSWDELTPAYRARLKRGGINRRAHEAGVALGKARGHKEQDRWAEFRRLDGHHIVRGFDGLSIQEKDKVARWWKLGFMSPGPHDMDRAEARENFIGWMQANQHDMTGEDWETFRDDYKTIFGGG